SATGWIADRWGGGRVTLWVFALMMVGVLGILYFLGIKDQPYAFWGFFAMFLVLFFATGVGNASTFQMIPNIMRREMDRLMPTAEDRAWEDGNGKRWQHDKIVRSTHGANCTGSCSWKIYVKGGIVTWETQQTDYPRTRPDLPNHEPRGCSRGASYSWYLYSGNRVKYPLVRSRLLKLWREARVLMTPVAAWKSIVEDPKKRASYVQKRGLGGFVRASWAEVNEIVASANAYTARTYGPDRVFGFSPIPAMSMVSYAAGARYLSLLGGVCMSFYDWYCDLPPASPQTWGEQTDVP